MKAKLTSAVALAAAIGQGFSVDAVTWDESADKFIAAYNSASPNQQVFLKALVPVNCGSPPAALAVKP